MSTSVETPDDGTAAVSSVPEWLHDDPLARWTELVRRVAPAANYVARTAFVPKALQGKPAEVTAVILAGAEVGLSPMGALRSIAIIDATPALYAGAMRGLVQSHGHQVWVAESSTTRAVVCGQRRGSEHVERVVWSQAKAKTAGMLSKRNWQMFPEQMLVARGTSEVCRRIASDVLLGLSYSVEELSSDAAASTETALDLDSQPSMKMRRARRAPDYEQSGESAEPDRDSSDNVGAAWPEVAIPGEGHADSSNEGEPATD